MFKYVQLFIWRLCIECIDFLNLSRLLRFTLKKSWANAGAKRFKHCVVIPFVSMQQLLFLHLICSGSWHKLKGS